MTEEKIRMGVLRNSEAIKALGFSGGKGESGVLRVEFRDGSTVDHANVPYAVYRGLVLSHSAGEYYNKFIRGKFKEEK